MNEYLRNFTSRWFRSFLFLLIIYLGQASQFYQLRHIHGHGFGRSGIDPSTITVELGHSSDHHNEPDESHTNDHQHTFRSRFDWHITGSKIRKTIIHDDQQILSTIPIIFVENNKAINANNELPLLIEERYASILAIRGPPILT